MVTVGHGTKFGRKKEAAIMALFTHRTMEEAAVACGVSPSTLSRWLKEPDFQAAYHEAKRAAFAQSISRLHQMTSAAVSTLGKVMVDPKTPAGIRVRAAESVLNLTFQSLENEDIEARVSELERTAIKDPGSPK